MADQTEVEICQGADVLNYVSALDRDSTSVHNAFYPADAGVTAGMSARFAGGARKMPLIPTAR